VKPFFPDELSCGLGSMFDGFPKAVFQPPYFCLFFFGDCLSYVTAIGPK